MSSDNFNKSTFSFGGNVAPLRSINYDQTAAEIKVTGVADTRHTYEAGIDDETLTVEIVGTHTANIGDKANIAIAWNDGSTPGSINNCVCVQNSTQGAMDGEITSTLKFRPSTSGGS